MSIISFEMKISAIAVNLFFLNVHHCLEFYFEWHPFKPKLAVAGNWHIQTSKNFFFESENLESIFTIKIKSSGKVRRIPIWGTFTILNTVRSDRA